MKKKNDFNDAVFQALEEVVNDVTPDLSQKESLGLDDADSEDIEAAISDVPDRGDTDA